MKKQKSDLDMAALAASIRQKRVEKGWTQQQLADRMAEHGAPCPVSTISAYERGSDYFSRGGRRPGEERLKAMAAALGITIEELTGKDSTRKKDAPQLDLLKGSRPLTKKEYIQYDQSPVLVVGDDIHLQWGIMGYYDRVVMCYDGNIPLSHLSVVYAPKFNQPDPIRKLSRLKQNESVLVKYISPDPQIREKLSGRYRVDQAHQCLVKSTGEMLPFEGLGRAYFAFSD